MEDERDMRAFNNLFEQLIDAEDLTPDVADILLQRILEVLSQYEKPDSGDG